MPDDPVFCPGIVIHHAQHAIAKCRDLTERPSCSRLGRVGLRESRVLHYFRNPLLRELPLADDMLSVARKNNGFDNHN